MTRLVPFTLILAVLFLAVAPVEITRAQNRDIYLGPMLEMGASINAGSIGAGSKTAASTAWCFGMNGVFPIAQNVAVGLTAGYDSRAIDFHNQAQSQPFANYTFNYFSFRPGFRFSDI